MMCRVVDPETVRKVCLYRPTTRTLSPVAEGFAEHLAHYMQHWSEAQTTRNHRRPPSAR